MITFHTADLRIQYKLVRFSWFWHRLENSHKDSEQSVVWFRKEKQNKTKQQHHIFQVKQQTPEPVRLARLIWQQWMGNGSYETCRWGEVDVKCDVKKQLSHSGKNSKACWSLWCVSETNHICSRLNNCQSYGDRKMTKMKLINRYYERNCVNKNRQNV